MPYISQGYPLFVGFLHKPTVENILEGDNSYSKEDCVEVHSVVGWFISEMSALDGEQSIVPITYDVGLVWPSDYENSIVYRMAVVGTDAVKVAREVEKQWRSIPITAEELGLDDLQNNLINENHT